MTIFGRLDVFYADGRSESHPLTGAVVSVGSAEDNTVRLDDAAVSPLHVRLRHRAGVVQITDLNSERGTYIDGARLPANAPRSLKENETIWIGGLEIRFYLRSDSPTQAIRAISEQTQPLAVGFRAELAKPSVSVWPTSIAETRLRITNLTEERSDLRLEVTGLPDGWVAPARSEFWLAADETLPISLHIKPTRRTDLPPGDYPLIITITRRGDSERPLRLAQTVKLGGFGGLSLALDPPIPNSSGSLTLHMRNLGNQEMSLRLAGHEPAAQLEMLLPRDSVRLAAGARTQVALQIRPRHRPIFGRPRAHAFALQATSDDPSSFCVALPGALTVRPRVTNRGLLAGLLLAAAVLAVLASLLLQPPEPVIARFSLSEALVAQGSPVILNWEATDALRYAIEVERVPIAELPAGRTSYSLDTSAYTDPIEVALVALQGEHQAIAVQRLDIYQPVVVREFAADKASMLRNVRGTLKVRWEVSGALELDISNPLGFETVARNSYKAGRGEMALRGAPAAAFQLHLSALDEIGAMTEKTIKIAIRDPECLPLNDTAIYAGPDSRFLQIQIALQNVPVLVHGTSKAMDWLLVELADGESGWASHSSFFCRGFNLEQLRVITDLPPLPTATPRATARQTDAVAQSETPGRSPEATIASATVAPYSEERSSG